MFYTARTVLRNMKHGQSVVGITKLRTGSSRLYKPTAGRAVSFILHYYGRGSVSYYLLRTGSSRYIYLLRTGSSRLYEPTAGRAVSFILLTAGRAVSFIKHYYGRGGVLYYIART